MLAIMFQKIRHKKWMVISLLLGSVLLTATVVSFPLYRAAAYDRMLRDEFTEAQMVTGEWPAKQTISFISKNDKEGKNIARTEAFLEELPQSLGMEEKERIAYYLLASTKAEPGWTRKELKEVSLRLGCYSDLPEHITITAGEMYSETGMDEEGYIEVIVSEAALVETRLLIDEPVQFRSLKGPDGEPLKIKIKGVFAETDSREYYWQVHPEEMSQVLLMNETLYRQLFLGANAEKYNMTCSYYGLYEYQGLQASQAADLLQEITYLQTESPYRSTIKIEGFRSVVSSYLEKQVRIDATLYILQVPVLILLCAFLLMISGQMYDMEKSEIAVMKSRGASGGQVFGLYLLQSMVLTVFGSLLGLPLGMLFGRILGSARNFLEFSFEEGLGVYCTTEVIWYLLAAAGVSIVVMTVPAIKHSRTTIVKLKQQNGRRKRSWWERCFLDIICLGVSLYGYYSFADGSDRMVEQVLSKQSLDPLLYLSSSLFIVGLGLFFLRLLTPMLRLVYRIGKGHWGPANYASFAEILKNGAKQQFIMLFLILTVSLGMFHATVARTILQNARANAEYLNPADIRIQEVWQKSSITKEYMEPDDTKYAKLEGADSITKVYEGNDYTAKYGKGLVPVTMLGIHTKQFGLMTQMDESLLEKPYYGYLNQLALEPEGVLVSRYAQEAWGMKVGDKLTLTDGNGNSFAATVLDFVDYWPGYTPTYLKTMSDGSIEKENRLLVIANFSRLQQQNPTLRYEVWVSLEEEGDTEGLYQWISTYRVHLRKLSVRAEELRKTLEDPLLQGTNGVLSMGFMVTMLLCATGYLIYWILSIRSREMLFGVLRASGMHKRELFHMLINEQILCGALPIAAAFGIGTLASKLFVPILQMAFAGTNQVLPIRMITQLGDILRLYGVVGAVMLLCLTLLLIMVFRMNVAKALKLGEE